MISIKSILVRYFSIVVVLLLVVFALMYMPVLASIRTKCATTLNISETDFVLVLCAVLVVSYLLIAWRLVSLISGTMVDLVKRAESNVLNISVGPKSPLMEVNRLTFVIESKLERTRELENLLDDAETNLERSERELEELVRGGASVEQGEAVTKELETLKAEAKSLEVSNAELSKSLEEERLERSRMSDSKKELRKAEALLGLVKQIKEPSFAISEKSNALKAGWEELSFSRIRADLEEIHRQSEIQNVAINKANASDLS